MRFQTDEQSTDGVPDRQEEDAIQRHIPWWGDIGEGVREQLALPDVEGVSARRWDVVVVGGGIAGLSAALNARRAGASVLALEREAMLGYGATGRNAGILSAGVNMHLVDLPQDGPEAAFWPATTALLLSLVEEARQPDALLAASLTGAISLAESVSAARKLAREARARANLGLRAEIWTPEQVAEQTRGWLDTRNVTAALWLPDEGRLNPLTLLAHLARAARREGVQFAGRANVVETREVANGSGSYRWQLHLRNGMTIEAGTLIQTVGPTVQANARIYALAFKADLPDTFPLFWDAAPYTYADYRSGNGRLTVSGGRYGKAGMTRHDARYYQRLVDSARRWLPELRGTEPAFTWAVDLAVTADMIPTLRPFGDKAHGYAIEGLGSLGVLPSMVLAQRIGELIASS